MAERPVTQERLEAGRDYLAALAALGFRPDGAMWAVHSESQDVQLALVSALVDRVGPLTIHEALFAAYERAKTPPSLDPWIVSLYSPNTAFGRHLAMSAIPSASPVVGHTSSGDAISLGEPWVMITDWLVQPSWIYKLPGPAVSRP